MLFFPHPAKYLEKKKKKKKKKHERIKEKKETRKNIVQVN
jgi:hypothetical protein